MFEHLRRAAAASRIADEVLYEQVVVELAAGERRLGLWAKALSDSLGDEQKAKGLYIRYRVQSIRDEIEILKAGNPKSTVENVSREKKSPTEPRRTGAELPQPPTELSTLVDMLAEALDAQGQEVHVSRLIENLRSNGFDNETIETLVEDRLGPNGLDLLWRQPGFLQN